MFSTIYVLTKPFSSLLEIHNHNTNGWYWERMCFLCYALHSHSLVFLIGIKFKLFTFRSHHRHSNHHHRLTEIHHPPNSFNPSNSNSKSNRVAFAPRCSATAISFVRGGGVQIKVYTIRSRFAKLDSRIVVVNTPRENVRRRTVWTNNIKRVYFQVVVNIVS